MSESTTGNNAELERIRELVEPIASDLDLDVYDVERRGATVRVTIDTPAGSDGGITLDNLSLATRLISREIDHEDPIPGRFTLEVSSPGLERHLRTPAHFQRETGKIASVRFRDPNEDPRRIEGQILSADDNSATLLLDDGTERIVQIDAIDKARTVFVWGPKPKPGGKNTNQPKKNAGKPKNNAGKSNTGKNNSNKSDPDTKTEMETQTS